MKLKTFLRKVPLLFGAVLLITVFLFASCQVSKQDDDDKDKDKKEKAQDQGKKDAEDVEEADSVTPTKDPTLSFALDADETSNLAGGGKYAVKYDNGGVTGDKTYYKTPAPDSTKHFTLTATAAPSKGAVTYSLWSVGNDGEPDAKIEDVNTATVDGNGKVTVKATKAGFYYLKANIEAKGEYRKAEAKALLVVGTVPVPADAVMFNGVAVTGDGVTDSGAGANVASLGNLTVNKAGKTITLTGVEDDKKFIVQVTVDHNKFPADAPRYAPTVYTYTATNTNATNFIETVTKNTDNNVVVTEGDGTANTNDPPASEVKLELGAAAPYAAVAEFTVVTVDN